MRLRTAPEPPPSALALLRRADFRNLYLAVSASELGDSLHYIALMWFALDAGGPLGVIAVRLADSIPALVFGLHGGLAADRWDRRRLMIAADVARVGVLAPGRRRRPDGSSLALGAHRRRVPARGGNELFRTGVRRIAPGARRAGERPAGQRTRPGDGSGAVDRRLGDRRGAAHRRADQHVLRHQRRDLRRSRRCSSLESGSRAAEPAASRHRACARASPRCDPARHWRWASSCSASR